MRMHEKASILWTKWALRKCLLQRYRKVTSQHTLVWIQQIFSGHRPGVMSRCRVLGEMPAVCQETPWRWSEGWDDRQLGHVLEETRCFCAWWAGRGLFLWGSERQGRPGGERRGNVCPVRPGRAWCGCGGLNTGKRQADLFICGFSVSLKFSTGVHCLSVARLQSPKNKPTNQPKTPICLLWPVIMWRLWYTPSKHDEVLFILPSSPHAEIF